MKNRTWLPTVIGFVFLLSSPSCRLETTTGPQTGEGTPPPAFYLNQNFPNPFTDTTTIKFGVPSTGGYNSLVSVIVYDRFHQEIRTIVYNNSLAPGNYETKWDGKNAKGSGMPGGMYIIELRGYTPQTTIIRISVLKK